MYLLSRLKFNVYKLFLLFCTHAEVQCVIVRGGSGCWEFVRGTCGTVGSRGKAPVGGLWDEVLKKLVVICKFTTVMYSETAKQYFVNLVLCSDGRCFLGEVCLNPVNSLLDPPLIVISCSLQPETVACYEMKLLVLTLLLRLLQTEQLYIYEHVPSFTSVYFIELFSTIIVNNLLVYL